METRTIPRARGTGSKPSSPRPQAPCACKSQSSRSASLYLSLSWWGRCKNQVNRHKVPRILNTTNLCYFVYLIWLRIKRIYRDEVIHLKPQNWLAVYLELSGHSRVQEMVADREAWHAAAHGVAKNRCDRATEHVALRAPAHFHPPVYPEFPRLLLNPQPHWGLGPFHGWRRLLY